MHAFGARHVLFVADQARRYAVERVGQWAPRADEAGLFAQLADSGFERRLTRFELAADRQPRLQSAMLDHEHPLATPRIHRDRERAPRIRGTW